MSIQTYRESMDRIRSCEEWLGPIHVVCGLLPRQMQRQYQTREKRTVSARLHRYLLTLTVSRESSARENLAVVATALTTMASWERSETLRDTTLILIRKLFPGLIAAPPLPPPPLNIPPHYAALHLTPGCPLAVAEAAYRALARQHHPDLGGDPERMKTINAAIERLRKELT